LYNAKLYPICLFAVIVVVVIVKRGKFRLSQNLFSNIYVNIRQDMECSFDLALLLLGFALVHNHLSRRPEVVGHRLPLSLRISLTMKIKISLADVLCR
jgi:hypothetical protein